MEVLFGPALRVIPGKDENKHKLMCLFLELYQDGMGCFKTIQFNVLLLVVQSHHGNGLRTLLDNNINTLIKQSYSKNLLK